MRTEVSAFLRAWMRAANESSPFCKYGDLAGLGGMHIEKPAFADFLVRAADKFLGRVERGAFESPQLTLRFEGPSFPPCFCLRWTRKK